MQKQHTSGAIAFSLMGLAVSAALLMPQTANDQQPQLTPPAPVTDAQLMRELSCPYHPFEFDCLADPDAFDPRHATGMDQSERWTLWIVGTANAERSRNLSRQSYQACRTHHPHPTCYAHAARQRFNCRWRNQCTATRAE